MKVSTYRCKKLAELLICLGLQFVEFAGIDDLEDEATDVRMPNPNAEKANKQHAQSLESLLMTKNKRLLDEVTRFRVRISIPV